MTTMSHLDEIPPDFVGDGDSVAEAPVKPLDTVIALYDFPATSPLHLHLRLGDTVWVLAKLPLGWWDGVLSQGGELQRGWFPHNFVRSVNYVQPVLNKLKSNKELDLITAANTAANSLIPLFTRLLQKNLGDAPLLGPGLEKLTPVGGTRKNSVVLFASDDTLGDDDRHHFDSVATTQHNPLVATTITAGLLEMLEFHNSANENPLGGAEALSDDHEFVLEYEAERLADEHVRTTGVGVTWVPRCTTGGDFVFYLAQLHVYCTLMPPTNFSAIETEVPPELTAPLVEVLAEANQVINTDPPAPHKLTSQGFDEFKRDSNALLMLASLLALLYHLFSQSFFYPDDLFYPQPGDVKRWDQIPPAYEHVAELAMRALRDLNKPLFTTHLDRMQKVVSFCILALRLTQDDFVGTKWEMLVKRKLRRLTLLFAQFYINGILHLLMSHYLKLLSGLKPLNNHMGLLNKLSPLNEGFEESENVPDGQYLAQVERERNSLSRTLQGLVRIFNKVTAGKQVLRRHYDSLDTEGMSDDEPLTDSGADRLSIMPQVYPRFLTDEFNGGNWCNPFFVSNNPVLNVSGDDLKNRYHSKVIIDLSMYEQVVDLLEKMVPLSEQTLELLDAQRQHMYFNDNLKHERNTHVLRLIYKFLFHALLLVDLIELLDFTVFCLVKKYSLVDGLEPERRTLVKREERPLEFHLNLTFDYPIVLEFFQLKQKFHDLIMAIIMGTQALTLEDPEVFRGLRDEDDVFVYSKEHMKQPTEKAALLLTQILLAQLAPVSEPGVISRNPDSLLSGHIIDLVKFLLVIQGTLQRLIEERETILNYATRVLHDDLNVQLLVIERNNTVLLEKTLALTLAAAPTTAKKGLRGSGASDTPWFLDGDEEFDLHLDQKGNVKGGTKEALVAHLTHHDLFDSNFNATFLLTFSTMVSLGELLVLLINRFNIDAPDGLLYDEYNLWILKKRNPIRLRVMNIMKLIVEKHWTDLYYNELVLRRWLQFAQLKVVQQYLIGKLLAADLVRVLNHEQVCIERQPVVPHAKPPAPLTKGLLLLKKVKLMDIDYVELARQLTLREFAMYLKISKFACIAKVWGKKLGLTESYEDITNFIRALNQLTNFVAYMILLRLDPKKRVQVIRYWVQVAEKCRQYNNFSLMTAIILALYSLPIHRLKKTWRFLSGDTLLHLNNMDKFMNSLRNFNEYRDVLKFIGLEPCVPFFGVYLLDLTFVYHGNPDNLMNRLRLYNFAKRAKTCEIVTGIDRFKTVGYNFQPVKEIHTFLDNWFEKCPTIAEQYQLSLKLEPREVSAPVTPASGASSMAPLESQQSTTSLGLRYRGHRILPNLERMILRS